VCCIGINQIIEVVVVTTGSLMLVTLPAIIMAEMSNTGEMETGKLADIMVVITAEEISSCQRTTTVVFSMLAFVDSRLVMHRHRNTVGK